MLAAHFDSVDKDLSLIYYIIRDESNNIALNAEVDVINTITIIYNSDATNILAKVYQAMNKVELENYVRENNMI